MPGTGKTTIARALAKDVGAIHIRIDTIEQALRDMGLSVVDEGYRVAYALAEDNLRLGHDVIADSVNPIDITRKAWHAVAKRAGVRHIDVEIVCSDKAEHRRRIESRTADIPNHTLPTWAEIEGREYAAWTAARLVVDTSLTTATNAVEYIRAALAGITR